MLNRKKFLQLTTLVGAASVLSKNAQAISSKKNMPVAIATWDAGMDANKAAWTILSNGGAALDAVEKGVMQTEDTLSCCVGLGGNPDRDGKVTLDACIMDHQFNCGSVAFLERIKHPISVARRVMERTPHVMLVGEGAQQFAITEGFHLEPQKLSDDAEKAYKEWLKTSKYDPQINREQKGHGPSAPAFLPDGTFNHDTIAMLAIDKFGNLSGSCTTSGMGFKMRGRVGDSPIIGSGLFVDNEVGACAATGQGEDIIRVAGSHSVVEMMRHGYSPEMACKKVIERIIKIKKQDAQKIQVAFIAINNNGIVGAYAIHKGFNYALKTNSGEKLIAAKSIFK